MHVGCLLLFLILSALVWCAARRHTSSSSDFCLSILHFNYLDQHLSR